MTKTILLFWLILETCANVTFAQSPRRWARTYDRHDASREAYRMHEERRQWRVGMQGELNSALGWLSYQVPLPPQLAGPLPVGRVSIWGRPPLEPPVRSPVAQRQEQTGPNTWVSRPVYADEFDPTSEPTPRDAEAVESPPIESAPEEIALPRPEELPPPRRATGPREF